MNFESHCRRVWSSGYFKRLGSLYWRKWPRGPWCAGKDEVVVDGRWAIDVPAKDSGFLARAIDQFRTFRRIGFGITEPRSATKTIRLALKPSNVGAATARRRTTTDARSGHGSPSHIPSSLGESFGLRIESDQITISSSSKNGLAHGLFHLERMMELRGAPILPLGRQTLTPQFDLRLHCDVWGGYTVTPRWMDVPYRKETFLLMARHGINATQIRAKLGDFFHDPRYPEISNPRWRENYRHLRRVVEQAGECGLRIILHGDNFRLPPDHPLFHRKPLLKGSPIFTGVVCPICTGSREGLDLIARGWEEVFRTIPELGGLIAIVGGECFTHCAMRPKRTPEGRHQCPRCGPRHSADVASQLIEAVTARVHRVAPHAKILAWPYSAESPAVWNADHPEMERFIRRLPRECSYVLEIDKEGVQPVRGAPGVFRAIWDYSSSYVGPASRFVHQSAIARAARLPLCVKSESLQGWEAGFAPYLPIMDHWKRRWTLLRRTGARDIHMGWPLFGFNDAPPTELAAWQVWKQSPSADAIVRAMTERDFGRRAAPIIRRAYRLLGEALEMLPTHCIGYYTRVQVMGAANPLLLDKDEPLEDAFYGYHFYEGEGFSTLDPKQIKRSRLPLDANYLHPHHTESTEDPPLQGARCVRRADRAWMRALQLYESVERFVPLHCRERFIAERRLLRYLGHMWHCWANLEEFYWLRSRLTGTRVNCYWNEHFEPRRRPIVRRMLAIARDDLHNARRSWATVRGDDRLDPSLRLDTPTVPLRKLYEAKFRHTRKVIEALRKRLEG